MDFTNLDNFRQVPRDKFPLFGEIYLYLDKELAGKLAKVYMIDNKKYILKSQWKHMNLVSLTAYDPVYNHCSMHVMIKQAFKAQKDFICAKVISKTVASYEENQGALNQPVNYNDVHVDCNDPASLIKEVKHY